MAYERTTNESADEGGDTSKDLSIKRLTESSPHSPHSPLNKPKLFDNKLNLNNSMKRVKETDKKSRKFLS